MSFPRIPALPDTPPTRRRGVRSLLMAALVAPGLVFVGCDSGDTAAKAPAKSSKRRAKVVQAKKDQKIRALEAAVNRNLSSLAGGAQVRIVWIEDPNRKTADSFAVSEALRLSGWDSQGGGYRRIIDDPGNYGRPLLTPNGREIVYTDKQVERKGDQKHLSPEIHLVNWSGDNDRVLGSGFAVDVRLDPGTARTWVYALEKITPAKTISMAGTTLVRFPLDDPARREVVWTRTPLSVDNLQMSRDGARFAALFPWPNAGVGEVATGRWHKLDIGCWPSMAPDDSYVSWVFDGLHRKLRMYAPDGSRRWMVDLSSAPNMGGREAYHPRWSNHPRFAVFTGPYGSKKRGRNSIATGGLTAEVYVGRFSESLDRMESFIRLTHNSAGDFYPDVWIADGEDARLASFPQRTRAPVRVEASWPPDTEHLGFVWENLKADNEVPDAPGRQPCHLEARGIARFSPFLGAVLDGGWFEADAGSEAALAAGVRKEQEFTLQALITEWASGDSGTGEPLVSWRSADGAPWFQLARHGGRLVVGFGRDAAAPGINFDHPINPGRAYALGISAGGGLVRISIDGRPVGSDHDVADAVFAEWPDGRLVVGDPRGRADGRRATLERLTIQSVALAQTHLAARAEADLAAAGRRPSPAPLRLRARLIEATEPSLEKLDTYHRMLVDHTYEVTQVLEGSYEHKRVVVLHWAVLDDRPVTGVPREDGREYELRLEPHAAHPELDGELTDITSSEFGLPMFLDVATPAPLVR